MRLISRVAFIIFFALNAFSLSSCGTIPTSFWYVEPERPAAKGIAIAQMDNETDLVMSVRQTYGVENKNFLMNLALTKPTDKAIKVCFTKVALQVDNREYSASSWWANKNGNLSIPEDFHATDVSDECLIYKRDSYTFLWGEKVYIGFQGEKGGSFEYFLLKGVDHYWHEDAKLIAKFQLFVDGKGVYEGEVVKDLHKESHRPIVLMR